MTMPKTDIKIEPQVLVPLMNKTERVKRLREHLTLSNGGLYKKVLIDNICMFGRYINFEFLIRGNSCNETTISSTWFEHQSPFIPFIHGTNTC
jgi:hypothetical protein